MNWNPQNELSIPDPSHWSMQGLVGWWRMNEARWNGVNNDVIDSSGRGNHGKAYNGVTTALSERGRAGSFDGVDDYVSCGNISSTANGTATVSAWFKLGSQLLSSRAITYNLRLLGDGSTYMYIYPSAGGTGYVVVPVSSWKFNAWNHIAVTWSGDGTTVKGYVNGNIMINNVTGVMAIQNIYSDNIFTIGARYTGSNYFNNLIDDVRVYNRALSANEVWQLYMDTQDTMSPLYASAVTRISKIAGVSLEDIASVGGIPMSSIEKIAGVQ